MQKSYAQIKCFENFSDLNNIFFKKKTREGSLISQTQDNTLKKVWFHIQIKTYQTNSAAPIKINEVATLNDQNQAMIQQLCPGNSNGNNEEKVVQLMKENIQSISHYISKNTVEKEMSQQQIKKQEKQEEFTQIVQDVSDLYMMQIEFLCEICQKQYKNKKTYNSHVQTKHNETKPFQCNLCQKGFKRTDYLLKHKQSHNEDREFTCNECDQKFKSRPIHEKHVKTVHAKIVCGTCKCCNKGFTRMDYLKKHLQRGQQNYKCVHQGCEKKFSSRQSMERHNSTKHQG